MIICMQVADIVFVHDGQVLLVQQKKKVAEELWSYPGGAVEDEETLEQALIREVQEELGVTLKNPIFLKSYVINNSRGKLTINTFTGSFVGNIQLKKDELSAYKWFNLEDLRQSTELRGSIVIKQAEDALSQNN